MYEINTWAHLEELSSLQRRHVTLGRMPDNEWDTLAELGFDLVWLMGVWKRSAAGRRISRTSPNLFGMYDEALPGWTMRNVVGSAYSIQAYEPDPYLGTWEEIDTLRAKLHARGMGLILDFVPNHTGLDHPWVAVHPEYYVQGAQADFRQNPAAFYLAERSPGSAQGTESLFIACGKDPYFPPWTDVAQLNYFLPQLQQAVMAELEKIAQHCDGVRCDMSMLVLNEVFAQTWGALLGGIQRLEEEFWWEVTRGLSDFIWMAEAYWDLEWRLQQLGVDFTYDKRLYDRLRDASAAEIADHLLADALYQSRMARFLENHDEPRSLAAFGSEKLRAVAVLVATLPGLRFYHQGQLEGRRVRIPVQLDRAREETPELELRAFYERLLHISNEDVFHSGVWRLAQVQPCGDESSRELIAYTWRTPSALSLIVVNLSGSPAQGRVPMAEFIDSGKNYSFRDKLNGVTYGRPGPELSLNGLYVRLERYASHVFSIGEA